MATRRRHRWPRCVNQLRRRGKRPRVCGTRAEFRLTFDLALAGPGQSPGRSHGTYCHHCAGAFSSWACCTGIVRLTPDPEDFPDV